MNSYLRLTATVKGRVQGVGYRQWTVKSAGKLGLRGYVKNMPDGSVLVVAEGDDNQIDRLRSLLYEGPIAARVEDVSCKQTEATGEFSTFEISQ